MIRSECEFQGLFSASGILGRFDAVKHFYYIFM
jgi:hypothetical protein